MEFRCENKFYDLPEIHHGDAIRDVLNCAEIMGNEQISQSQPILQLLQQIEYLRLNGDVKCRDGLIRNKIRLSRQAACDPDSLALAPGEFVRIAAG
jgi:hypothetical protein